VPSRKRSEIEELQHMNNKELLLKGLTRLGPHSVPNAWRAMLPAALWDLAIPSERRATCDLCPRVVSDQFRPDYKCCTYLPRVPNFMLGLAASEKRGHAAVERALAGGFLMPEGLQASPELWALFLVDVGEERFGKSEKTLCPFLETQSGRCEIYAFRNAVCSTYFCHFDHGKRGERFWETLQTLIMQVEMALGQWALQSAGFDVPSYIERLNGLAKNIESASRSPGGRWSKSAQKSVWGSWYGRELELYDQCARLIEKHKHELWDIANRTDILEAARFELAAQSVVPKAHRDQIEDDFTFDPSEHATATPNELWRDVLRVHRKLWDLPETKGEERVRLSRRVRVEKNALRDAEERHFKDRPAVLNFLARPDGPSIKWRQFLTAAEATALAKFAAGRKLSSKTLKDVGALVSTSGEAFVAEWIGRGVLVVE
jgi:Fe-S-cluster containining protein